MLFGRISVEFVDDDGDDDQLLYMEKKPIKQFS